MWGVFKLDIIKQMELLDYLWIICLMILVVFNKLESKRLRIKYYNVILNAKTLKYDYIILFYIIVYENVEIIIKTKYLWYTGITKIIVLL